jgi:hypothetical protein
MNGEKNWHLMVRALAVLIAGAAFGAGPESACAGFLPQYTGNTQMSDSGATVGGVVDFAVYQNPSGHNWAADLGITPALTGSGAGGGAVDTSASFVYFYEIVNTAPNPGDGTIGIFNVGNTETPFTSGGWLKGYVFADASNNAVGPPGNPFLGSPPGGDDPSNSAPSTSGVTLGTPPFTNSGVSPTDPTGVASLGGSSSAGMATFLWTILFGNALIGQNAYSPVLFFTSDKAPSYGPGFIADPSGLNGADGGIPSQAPEPGTLLMWGLGGIAFVIMAKKSQGRRLAATV